MNEGGQYERLQTDGMYPMRVVTRLTGLTADTIRAWERRYSAVRPSRTSGNTRKYSADEVRRLMLLREATQSGHSISSIASLSLGELESMLTVGDPLSGRSKVGLGPSDRSELEGVARGYLAAVNRFDARRALELLNRAASVLAPRDLVFEVVLPVLREVGERWSHRELGIAQEHLVSVQLGGVLSTLIRLLPPERDKPQILITTPAGHLHEFGAQVAALLAASRGFEPLYLGCDLPDEDLLWSTRISRARLVVLSIARDVGGIELSRLSRTIDELTELAEVWVGLPEGNALVHEIPKARVFHRYEDYDRALGELR